MKPFLILLALLISSLTFAEAVKLRIEKYDEGQISTERDLLYFSDGRVGVLPLETKKELDSFEVEEGSIVEVELDENHNIISLKVVSDSEEKFSSQEIITSEDEKMFTPQYEPTVLPNMDHVNSIFKRMNRRWQRESQCYNRAHVWNYEEFQRTGVRSKKVFIFYTRKYIREYNFYWWFHAIPTVLVNHEGVIVERALDPMFARRPLPMKSWSDIFIRSKRECPVITKYSTYENNQESEHCYLHYSSMYYWQPRDLDRYERTGQEKTMFIRSEVNHAYWEAF